MNFKQFIVVLVIALNVWFTVYALEVCKVTGQSIDALAVGFFAFTSTELWALSKIQREKYKGGKQNADDFSEIDEP